MLKTERIHRKQQTVHCILVKVKSPTNGEYSVEAQS